MEGEINNSASSISAHVVTNKMTSLSLPGYPDSNLRNVNEMKLGCIASENGWSDK